jgi:hypothetical protein
MRTRCERLLFVTSFLPVIIFKVIARGGAGTLTQVKAGVFAGLILALAQFGLSRRFLKYNTYLEKAFLGFLAVGMAWIYLAPPDNAILFALYSTGLLYFTLFLTTLLPQLAGYDPFTYAIAKQWYPAAVWNTPDFRTINYRITYLYSFLFLCAFLSSFLGRGLMLFTIVLPLVLLIGLGLPFSLLYPKYYLKRKFGGHRIDPSLLPRTARELVLRMPLGFDASAASGINGDIQFDLSGEGGGKLFLSLKEGACNAHEGASATPLLTIRSPPMYGCS